MVSREEYEQHEDDRLADKSVALAVVLGIFLPPVSYVYLGRWWMAFLNLITLNFLLTGFVVVPVDTSAIILDARRHAYADGVRRHPLDYLVEWGR